MMSLNYSAEEFLKIMMTLNFEKFEDGLQLCGVSLTSVPGTPINIPPRDQTNELPPFWAPVHLRRVPRTHETSVFFSR
jgi:hypothetical protein